MLLETAMQDVQKTCESARNGRVGLDEKCGSSFQKYMSDCLRKGHFSESDVAYLKRGNYALDRL